MSEWLDLMLEEVERKKNEVAEAEAEAARREAGDDSAATTEVDPGSVQIS